MGSSRSIDQEFIETVYRVTSMIPRGQVASYGQIATYVISPRYARAVGRALKMLTEERARQVPWQRVINASGRISARGDVARPVLQEKLLIEEGVIFEASGRVRFEVFGWAGPPSGWVPPYDEPKPSRMNRKVGRSR